jgi:hypothetical protein
LDVVLVLSSYPNALHFESQYQIITKSFAKHFYADLEFCSQSLITLYAGISFIVHSNTKYELCLVLRAEVEVRNKGRDC